MNQTKHFAAKTALVVGVSMLVGVSAFAESRHRNETRSSGGDRSTSERSDRGTSRSGDSATRREQHIERGEQSRGNWQRSDGNVTVQPDRGQIQRDRTERGDRSGTWNRDNNDRNTRNDTWNRNSGDHNTRNDTWNRNDRSNRNDTWNRNNSDRSRGNNRNDTWNRNDSRNRSNGGWNRNDSRGSYGRQSYRGHGRVSRYQRYGNGYHVWISGCAYPFYIPLAYYSSHHIRVGVALDLFGYYNPLGYYDYYDPGMSFGAVRSEFRGVVEEVDYRRDRLVVRNDESGNFVTVNLSNRRYADVRPGDSVVIEGDWTRSNIFVAYDVRLLDDDRYDDYNSR